jgi:hypothetical protein
MTRDDWQLFQESTIIVESCFLQQPAIDIVNKLQGCNYIIIGCRGKTTKNQKLLLLFYFCEK